MGEREERKISRSLPVQKKEILVLIFSRIYFCFKKINWMHGKKKLYGSFAPSDSWMIQRISSWVLWNVCLSQSGHPPAGKRRGEGLNRTPISVCKLLGCWGRGEKSGTAARIKMRGRKLGKQNSHSPEKKVRERLSITARSMPKYCNFSFNTSSRWQGPSSGWPNRRNKHWWVPFKLNNTPWSFRIRCCTVLYIGGFLGSDSRRQTRGRLLHATWPWGFFGLSRPVEAFRDQRSTTTPGDWGGLDPPRMLGTSGLFPRRDTARDKVFFSWSVVAALYSHRPLLRMEFRAGAHMGKKGSKRDGGCCSPKNL